MACWLKLKIYTIKKTNFFIWSPTTKLITPSDSLVKITQYLKVSWRSDKNSWSKTKNKITRICSILSQNLFFVKLGLHQTLTLIYAMTSCMLLPKKIRLIPCNITSQIKWLSKKIFIKLICNKRSKMKIFQNDIGKNWDNA